MRKRADKNGAHRHRPIPPTDRYGKSERATARERHDPGNRRTNQPAARSPQIDRHPLLPPPGGGGTFEVRGLERARRRGSGERRKGTPVLAAFLFSCSMGKSNCFVKKKDDTAISYENSHRPITCPIYHHRHLFVVSSPLLVPSVSLSLIRLAHCFSYLISFSSIAPAAITFLPSRLPHRINFIPYRYHHAMNRT